MGSFDLFAATVTSVPFLLLSLLKDTFIFGPAPGGPAHRRRGSIADLCIDLFAVFMLAVAFGVALRELATGHNGAVARTLAGWGLALGASGVFIHVGVAVFRLHRPREAGARPADPQ